MNKVIYTIAVSIIGIAIVSIGVYRFKRRNLNSGDIEAKVKDKTKGISSTVIRTWDEIKACGQFKSQNKGGDKAC